YLFLLGREVKDASLAHQIVWRALQALYLNQKSPTDHPFNSYMTYDTRLLFIPIIAIRLISSPV
ncbi:MAG: hypothetical protein ACPL7O_13180, partial [Armatimonadota bacterium]